MGKKLRDNVMTAGTFLELLDEITVINKKKPLPYTFVFEYDPWNRMDAQQIIMFVESYVIPMLKKFNLYKQGIAIPVYENIPIGSPSTPEGAPPRSVIVKWQITEKGEEARKQAQLAHDHMLVFDFDTYSIDHEASTRLANEVLEQDHIPVKEMHAISTYKHPLFKEIVDKAILIKLSYDKNEATESYVRKPVEA